MNINKLITATFIVTALGGCVQKRTVDTPPPESNETVANCPLGTEPAPAAAATSASQTTSEPVASETTQPPVTEVTQPPESTATAEMAAASSTSTTMSDEEFDQTVDLANALYVQVFVTKSKDTAKKVLSDIEAKYPDKVSVIKTAGMYKVIVGPYTKEDIEPAKENIRKLKDYESAFIITHFKAFQQ
ncbi:SPOR domain-containing protein [Vibrio paucivorans]|uniref:SPOR domain-containing protein n=1 Tax=Vibrio paucivorans TaxID=2829489 RepID=A0A9X3CIK3_9VIBR|nr:SPOR domain-containing protein [Vibrio paucivorans]MCW8336503.1 SPOR domain-containing protein [Vibrio paucivorans]